MTALKPIEITYAEVPLYCPRPEHAIWNQHPKVMIPIEETGKGKCPYCGAEYVLKDWNPHHSSH